MKTALLRQIINAENFAANNPDWSWEPQGRWLIYSSGYAARLEDDGNWVAMQQGRLLCGPPLRFDAPESAAKALGLYFPVDR